MEYIVDRIEGEYAVCECMGQMYSIPLTSFEGKVSEGDVVIETDGRYTVDIDARERRKKEIVEKMEDVWEN